MNPSVLLPPSWFREFPICTPYVGRNIVGFLGVPIQFFGGKALLKLFFPYSSEVPKAVGKRTLKVATDVGQDMLEGKNVIKSAKSHGKQAVSVMEIAAVNKVMIRRGRKKGEKRSCSRENCHLCSD